MRLGALSNGVYLLHLPAIGVANSIFARLNFTPPFGDLLLGLVMVMAAAELSFRYYEAPS